MTQRLFALGHLIVPSQTPPPPAGGDIAGMVFLALFALAFVGLAIAFLVKARRKRIAELAEELDRPLTAEQRELAAEAERSDEERAAQATLDATAAEERKAREAVVRDDEEHRQRREEAKAQEQRARYDAEAEVGREAAALREGEGAEAPAGQEAKVTARTAEAAQQQVDAERKGKLRDGLTKTRTGFIGRLSALFAGKQTLDQPLMDELEQVLVTSDIGVKTAQYLLATVQEKVKKHEVDNPDKVRALLKREIAAILTIDKPRKVVDGGKPYVIMVIGVNGGGKTTTIGKLAHQYGSKGKKVLVGAGDTFRAAAADQLEVWAGRASADICRGKEGQDPSSVLFDAAKRGLDQGADLVIADTAGRLHTKTNLMEELKKVHRTLGKAVPGAPHEVLLVLDATTGQNAIAQAQQFNAAVPVDGVVLTKLDGTAKGGVIVGICKEFQIPVRYIGIGEQVDDLREFEPAEFVEALFAESV